MFPYFFILGDRMICSVYTLYIHAKNYVQSCTSESATHCSRPQKASGGAAATSVAVAVRPASAQSICAESGRMEVKER